MKVFFVVSSLMLGSGCFWANAKSGDVVGYEARAVLGTDGHIEGGSLHAMGGFAGLTGDVEANVRDATRSHDPATYHDTGVGVSARGSLFGILATDHELERYFDFGGEAGASFGAALGVPPHDAAFTPALWYGAWVEIGTLPVERGYLALTGGVRREVLPDPWHDQTQLTIGLAWRKRETIAAGTLRWRD